jgi:hypothetical protein
MSIGGEPRIGEMDDGAGVSVSSNGSIWVGLMDESRMERMGGYYLGVCIV